MLPPVATLSPTDRPRERLWSLGPGALTTAELLAILLGTGSGASSVLEVAGRLLDLPLYDHVIIAGDRFMSFATAGLL